MYPGSDPFPSGRGSDPGRMESDAILTS
ncbi:protein of unknown function [Stenotrophomonas maltophilia]|nr:protein of unknown function [Stenotrophomonas maltophilia]